MLRYTKNGPSVWGVHSITVPALLKCPSETGTEKATFYGFHGEIKAARKRDGRACWSFLNLSVFCCFSCHFCIFYMSCCKGSHETVNAVGTGIRMRKLPLLQLLIVSHVRPVKRQEALCWLQGRVGSTGDG